MADKKEYFATLATKEIGSKLLEKKDEYYRHLDTSGRTKLLQRVYKAYHKPALEDGKVRRQGRQSEYLKLTVNHFRNLIQHRLSMTTNQRPHFEPKAANTDSKSQAQVALASGLLEYYNRIRKMERFTTAATEKAIAYGEGFIYEGWDATAGALFARQDGGAKFEGDAEFEALTTFDVIRDISKEDNDMHNWVMIRRYKNKYDLAAKYPKLEEKLTNHDGREDETYKSSFRPKYKEDSARSSDCEDIPVYTFLHRPSEALPEGRLVEFTDTDLIYADGPLPYRELPIYRIAPAEEEGCMFGYTNAFDILPLQEAVDKLSSVILTNQATFGTQNIAVPKGSGINIHKLSSGVNVIEYDSKVGKPEPLQLTATPAEIFEYLGFLVQTMETIMGVNSVARGNPEDNLKSGAALALVQSMAIQFAQGLQASYIQLLEDVGTGLINLLQEFATTPRVALIAGKANRQYMREFKSDDIALINRVIVDMGNPLNRTIAGRVNLAEQLLQNGMVETPQQYVEVLTSGRIEPVLESTQSRLLLIRSENEKLAEGSIPPVLRTDDHELHIKEHLSVLDSPETREDPALVKAVLSHIQQHEQFLVPPAPVTPEQIDQSQMAQDEQGNIPEQLDATNPVTQEAGQVNLPNQPKNPLTGEQFDPTGGA